MGKVSISSVTNVNFLNISQANSLIAEFSINLSPIPGALSLQQYNNAIANCPIIVAKTIDNKVKVGDILFCFNSRNKFVCFHDELSYSLHSFVLPSGCNTLADDIFTQQPFVDKIKIITQYGMADSNGMIQLPWSYLCTQQSVSAAEMFDIKLTTTQLQNCPNAANVLAARIRKSDHFRDQYGKADQFPIVRFDFSVCDLFNCIGNGKDENVIADSDKAREIDMFQLPSTSCKLKSTRKSTKLNHVDVTCKGNGHHKSAERTDQYNDSFHQNISPSLQLVSNILPLGSVSVEQLKQILKFYGIELDINRRMVKAGFVEIIKGSEFYVQHLDSSPLLSDVLYCFDKNNIVICTYQNLNPQLHSVTIHKSTMQLYASTSSQTLSFWEGCRIWLQKAIGSVANKNFSVPWCALTEVQKKSVVSDFCEDLPQKWTSSSFWDLISNSKQFIKHYGPLSQEQIIFVGSINSPIDLSLLLTCNQVGSTEVNSAALDTFFAQDIKQRFEDPNLSEGNFSPNSSCNTSLPTRNHPAQVNETPGTKTSTASKEALRVEFDVENNSVDSAVNDLDQIQLIKNVKPNLGLAFTINVDDDFTLSARKETCPCPLAIIPSSSKCPKCNVACDSEILSCGICLQRFHFTCYPSEKGKEGTYKFMSSETFTVLSNMENITWLCNDCDSFKILDNVLELATVKVKEKVSSSLSKISHDMDTMEMELGDIETYPDKGSDIGSPVNLETSVSSIQCTTLDAEDFQDHSSSKEGQAFKTTKINPEATTQANKDHTHLLLEKNKVTAASNDPELVAIKSMDREGANTVDLGEFSISWSNSQNQNDYISEEVCQKCQKKCKESSKISCYICSLKIHFPCSSSVAFNKPLSKGKLSTAKNIIAQKNLKWFCNSCKMLSFSGAVSLVSSKLSEKGFNSKENVKHDEQVHPKSTKHFPKMQDEMCKNIKESIQEEIKIFRDDILSCIKEASSTSEVGNISPHQNKLKTQQSFSEAILLQQPRQQESRQGIIAPAPHDKVDPALSVIILNVKPRKFRSSAACKSEFNKHFVRMRIKSIFSTQAGNIIVELFEKEDVDKVLNNWKPEFFNTEDGARRADTKVIYMLNAKRHKEVIVKHVNKNWTEESIEAELTSSHNGFVTPQVKRFVKRDGSVLNTVKIDLDCNNDFQRASNRGIFLFGEHFKVELYIQQPKAHQCYNCKHFGHPSKWCTKKQKCEYCAQEGHTGTECILKGEIHEYRCINCDGNHSAKYHKCPVYVKHLRKFKSHASSAHE